MHCPNCGKPIADDAAFCGECGARVEVQPPAPQQPAAPAPTEPMPQQPAPGAPPAYNEAAYQQQYAQPGYQQQYAQPVYPQAYATPQPPKKKTGLIIAIVAVAGVVVVGAVVGGILLLRGMSDSTPDPSTSPTSSSSASSSSDSNDANDTPATSLTGYATPEEALAAEFPSDWVFTLQSEEDEWRIYWVGPPNSEYTDEVVVEWTLDDTWIVTEMYPLDSGDMVFPEDEAIGTVMTFLDFIMQDEPLEAQKLCISPFAEDPASASYSNGDFLGYEIVGIESQDDGTFLVHTSEEWRWGTEEYEYYVVPTELGYYISEMWPYGM